MRPALLACILCLIVGTAFGQSPEGNWANLRQLRTGQMVQIVDRRLKSTEGEFQGFYEETISLRRGQDALVFQRTDVIRVTTKGGRGSKALINASIGGLIGLVLGSLSDYYDDVDSSDPNSNYGKLSGAGVGIAIRAGIGAAFPGSRTIYRANPPKKN